MGDFRYFMCEDPNIISIADIVKHAPDHGLLFVQGRRVHVVMEAPRREENVDHPSEIRYLRFAIINRKDPYHIPIPRKHWLFKLL